MDKAIELILLYVVILIVLFFLLRKAVLWYFRISELVELNSGILSELKEIRSHLNQTNNQSKDTGSISESTTKHSFPDHQTSPSQVKWTCPKCGEKNMALSKECSGCGFSLDEMI